MNRVRTSRPDPVSTRNTIIIGKYAQKHLGSLAGIFSGLPYPQEVSGKVFISPEDFYMWEHGWCSLANYQAAYRNLRNFLEDPAIYFKCGATVAKYQSFGLIGNTKYVVGGVINALREVPYHNKSYNDTKDFIILNEPVFNENRKKVQCSFIIRFHDDIDPHDDYISDPHIVGILSQLPVLFGLQSAKILQPLVPYDLFKLCEKEDEFKRLGLDPAIEGDRLTIRDPITENKRIFARRVVLLERNDGFDHEYLCGAPVLSGEVRPLQKNKATKHAGWLVEGDLKIKLGGANQDTMTLLPSGTVLGAPYFITNYESDKEGSTLGSFFHAAWFKLNSSKVAKKSWGELISQLAIENREKNQAMMELEKAHNKLQRYSNDLELMVEERTKELREIQAQLLEAEKRSLEHRITGGFAHEMRNALAGAQMELGSLISFQGSGKPISEVAADAAAQLFRLINSYHQEYGIPRERLANEAIPIFKSLAETIEQWSKVHKDVEYDIERGLAITNLIREYARLHEVTAGEEKVNLPLLLEELICRYRSQSESQGILIEFSTADDAVITANPTHLRSIFENLIKNAIDALNELGDKEDKNIIMRLISEEVEGRSVAIVVTVQDNGPGISEEHLSQIFEPFFSTKPDKGTGLGLGIVRRLARLYGGDVEVESQPGEGATFTVTLPVSRQRDAYE